MNRAHAKAIADMKIGEVCRALKIVLRECKNRECALQCVKRTADDLHAFVLDASRQGIFFEHKAFFKPLRDALDLLTVALCVESAEVDSLAKAFETINAANQRIFLN